MGRVRLFLLLLLASACSGPQTREDGVDVEKEKIPLWVEISECRDGKPVVKKDGYSVLKMPDDKLYWVVSKRDGECRVFGAMVGKGEQRKPDACDIRFRSKDPVKPQGRSCSCATGRFDLQEGRPVNKKCCERYPDGIYCDKPASSLPEAAPRPETNDEPVQGND